MANLPDDNLPLDPPEGEPASWRSGSDSDDEPTHVTGSAGSGSGGGGAAVIPLGPSIEGYALREEIHRGGQGIVYRAIQLGTKRQVALKVLLEGPFAGETTRRRFEREIELAASLRHPNIVTILDSGLNLGRYYFAMEYIDGVRLDRYLAQRRPTREETLRLFEKVCLAVNFAHQRGVIHRDLKPPNILVDAEGEPHILDFGLAKPVFPSASSESTVQMLSMSGQLLGTVAYMSPEQAAGTQDVDVRTDVYSLGVIFYEALVGQPPYPVDGPLAEILQRIARVDPVNPRSLAVRASGEARIGDELATILLKALEKEPQRRYQTAGDLARDFRHLLQGEPIEAKRASGLYMLKKTLRRYRLQTAMAGLILVMLFAFLIALAVLLAKERDARRRADEKTEETRLAVRRQAEALEEARARTAEATQAQQDLRRALVRQHIQRGDLALERDDLREARESYWEALEVTPTPAAIWALRRYYLETPDNGAALLTLEAHGPSRLSRGARWTAACIGADAVFVRERRAAGTAHWVRTPGPVRLLDVGDDGALAAVGDDWVRVWRPRELRPQVAAARTLPDVPRAVHVLDGGDGALLVGERAVQLLSPVGEGERPIVLLQGTTVGPADYAPHARQLAIPTSAGVELVTVLDEQRLKLETIWTGAAPARAARFDGEELLGVLADAVYVATLAEAQQRRWTRFMETGTFWELFDLRQGVGAIVFGTRSGRLALAQGGEMRKTWNCAVARLEQICLDTDERAVLTLDDRGVVTQWRETELARQQNLVHEGAPTAWATSADGTTVLLAIARGQVLAYEPETTRGGAPRAVPALRTIVRPRLLGLGDASVSLAVSDDGRRAVVRDRTTLRLVNVPEGESQLVLWHDAVFPLASDVALSGDGEVVAMLVRSPAGDRERVVFWHWPRDVAGGPAARAVPGPASDFTGAVVRDILFLPRSHELLVARSSGQLLALAPPEVGGATLRSRAATTAAARKPGTSWMQLEAPPVSMAANRTGEYLAVAGEDNVVRVISVARREVRYRVPVGARVVALAFNPRDDILLIRTAAPRVILVDPAMGERTAEWPLPPGTDTLATWVGDVSDGLLLGHDGRVYEYRYALADEVIERNRAYAREQEITRHLSAGDFAAAWKAAGELWRFDAQRGHAARLQVVLLALRRPNAALNEAWFDTVVSAADATTLAQLGHAAYAGERFMLAREWLRRAADAAASGVDAMTALRLAECDYLAEDYAAAAAGLERVLTQPDFEPDLTATVSLERAAALVLDGRLDEARHVAQRIGAPRAAMRRVSGLAARRSLVATTYAGLIARLITGVDRETAIATLADGLLGNLGERSLYVDDEHFFGAEMDRRRGDRVQAAIKYQRCIDLSRDEWPANWARYRLLQLAGEWAAGRL